MRALVREFVRFAIVGGVATCIHYVILISLVQLARTPLLLATSVGFAFGSAFSYTLNRHVTFDHQPHFGKGFAKYLGVGAVGLAINGGIAVTLAGAGLPYLVAQALATGVVLVWNFSASRFIVFRPPAEVR